jgi:spore coat protein SA
MGSIAIWTYEIAKRLAISHDVTVYARRGADQPADEMLENIRFVRFDTGRDLALHRWLKRSRVDKAFLRPLFASPWFYRFYWRNVARSLQNQRFDIVHVPNFSQAVPLVRSKDSRCGIVLHMHCEWLSQLGARLVTRRIADADAVVGCSQYISRLIADRNLPFTGTSATIWNGAEVPSSAPARSADDAGKPLVLLFVGRITPEKGLHTMIEAFACIADEFPRARLRIIGPEAVTPREYIIDLAVRQPELATLSRFYGRSYLAQLRDMVPPGLRGRVDFRGPVPHAELAPWYASAHVLVNPSSSESFGMTLVEAMAQGLPVIASRVGGMPEIVVDGETGLLIAPGETGALADAMRRLLADAPLRDRMGQAGYRRASELFSWPAVARELEMLYEPIVRTKAA